MTADDYYADNTPERVHADVTVPDPDWTPSHGPGARDIGLTGVWDDRDERFTVFPAGESQLDRIYSEWVTVDENLVFDLEGCR